VISMSSDAHANSISGLRELRLTSITWRRSCFRSRIASLAAGRESPVASNPASGMNSERAKRKWKMPGRAIGIVILSHPQW